MDNYKKAVYYLAKANALTNAAAVLENDDVVYNDDDYDKELCRQNKIIATQLNNRGSVYYQKYNSIGIDIDITLHDSN